MPIKIQCKICNEISDREHLWSHLRKHNIKYQDYIQQNLDQFPQYTKKKCKECGSEIYKNNICDECSLKHRGILCRVCNKIIRDRKGFNVHLKIHNIKFVDYVEKNRDQFSNWIDCAICGKLTKQKTTCSKKCDKEYRKTLVGEKAIRYGTKLSDETINKISIANKKWLSTKENHPFFGKHLSKEHSAKISKTRREKKIAVGKNNGMYGKTHSPETIKKIFSYRKMNKIEKLVADYLDSRNIEYYFQFFITENKICKSYDFKIKNKPIIIEVDGDFWHGGPATNKYWKDVDKVKINDKLKEKIANNRGYKIIRFWQSDLQKDINIISKYL